MSDYGGHFSPGQRNTLLAWLMGGFWRRLYHCPSMMGSRAVETSRSTADWASSGPVIMDSHSAVRFEVTMVEARWWRSTQVS
jgi:hypothetical protein